MTEKNNRITPIIYNNKKLTPWISCGVSKRWLLKLGLCLTQLVSGNGAIAIFIKELERLKHCTRNHCHLLTQHQGHAGTPGSSQVLHEGLPGLTLSQKSYCFLWLSLHFSSHHHKSFDRQKVSKHTTKWRQSDVKLCEFLQTLILSKLLHKLTIAQGESSAKRLQGQSLEQCENLTEEIRALWDHGGSQKKCPKAESARRKANG